MSKKTDIWMPLFIGDYLADTMRLTTEQHGAYLLLLMEYWRSGPLPDDDEELASIAKLSPERWAHQRVKIERFFQIETGKKWHHKRADSEMLSAANRRKTAQENGKSGGRPRKSAKPRNNPDGNPKETQSKTQTKPSGNPDDNPNPNPEKSSSPSPSPNPIPLPVGNQSMGRDQSKWGGVS